MSLMIIVEMRIVVSCSDQLLLYGMTYHAPWQMDTFVKNDD